MPQRDRRCDQCEWWVPRPGEAPEKGWCKRFPPQVIRNQHDSGTFYEFPITQLGQWCGEFEPIHQDQFPPED